MRLVNELSKECVRMKEKKRSAAGWILEWAGQKRSAYVWSVVLAVLNVVFKIIPYFIIADVVKLFLDGNKDFKEYMIRAVWIALSFIIAELFHSLSTALSHKATFTVLANIRKACCEKLARVPVTVDIASEFRYREPLVGEGDLVIIISQSGETADSLAAMRLAKSLGAKTLAIVNAMGSSIAREADMLIYTHAGPEIAVASTKAYMVQIAVMYLFAFELALAVGKIDETECRRLVQLLQDTSDTITGILEHKEQAQYIASSLITADSLLYIGRGLDYALSMEGSLKLKEISYIHSESYAAGELKHGTISLITENMPVIAVATQKALMEKTISNIKEVKARGAKVILVCRESDNVDPDAVDLKFGLPEFDDLLMPMIAVVPLQLIAYYTSVLKGNDVDKPRNLAKSVTVE